MYNNPRLIKTANIVSKKNLQHLNFPFIRPKIIAKYKSSSDSKFEVKDLLRTSINEVNRSNFVTMFTAHFVVVIFPKATIIKRCHIVYGNNFRTHFVLRKSFIYSFLLCKHLIRTFKTIIFFFWVKRCAL